MKAVGKVDTSYRITIPKEIRESMGLDIGTQVNIEEYKGAILISFDTNKEDTSVNIDDLPVGAKYWEGGVLKVKLEPTDTTPQQEVVEEPKVVEPIVKEPVIEKPKKKTEILNEPVSQKYWENGILKSREVKSLLEEEQQKAKEELEKPLLCECGNEIIDCKMVINEKRVCRDCANKFRDRLKRDIMNYQKVKKLYNLNN